jgi:hypothetical protein
MNLELVAHKIRTPAHTVRPFGPLRLPTSRPEPQETLENIHTNWCLFGVLRGVDSNLYEEISTE